MRGAAQGNCHDLFITRSVERSTHFLTKFTMEVMVMIRKPIRFRMRIAGAALAAVGACWGPGTSRAALPEDGAPVGWAAVEGGTRGGLGGEVVTVTNEDSLEQQVKGKS